MVLLNLTSFPWCYFGNRWWCTYWIWAVTFLGAIHYGVNLYVDYRE